MVLTEDLYLAALALLRGGCLSGIEISGVNGRRMAVFRIEGEGLEEAEREYRRGPALVDLRLFKDEVRRLKDAAFSALREEERSHGGHAGRDRANPSRQPHRVRPR